MVTLHLYAVCPPTLKSQRSWSSLIEIINGCVFCHLGNPIGKLVAKKILQKYPLIMEKLS